MNGVVITISFDPDYWSYNPDTAASFGLTTAGADLLTFEAPLTTEQVAGLRQLRRTATESPTDYLARIIRRMDWHIARLRRMG